MSNEPTRTKVDITQPNIVGKVSRSLSKAEGRPYLRIYVKNAQNEFVLLGTCSMLSADKQYAFVRVPRQV